jgi:class 3 adenylate cyclase
MTVETSGVVTATVLFTDMVGSTALRARLGDDIADDVMAAHDELLQTTVGDFSGYVVKHLGDGVLATFGSAVQALEAAAQVQRRVAALTRRDPARGYALRIGLSAGDISVLGDDVAGTPVVEAYRLCEAAEGEQVLISDVVRVLVGSRAPGEVVALGPITLRGLPEPIETHRLDWQSHDDADAEHGVVLPPLLVKARTLAYCGRAAQLRKLWQRLDDALAGSPGSVLLAGEPGIGKTRTAAELARRAGDEGAVVLYGRCDEDLGAPYRPFVEVLSAYLRGARSPRLGRLARELGRLVPELPELVHGTPPPLASDPRTEEYRLFEAVAAWLVDASRDSGLVLVLDDLHWADTPTLSLLLHVLRAVSVGQARLLVVGTYRDTDVAQSSKLTQLLADVHRLPGSSRITLEGLEETEVVELLTVAAGHGLDPEQHALAVRVCQEGDGNPFFVAELLRHLVETDAMRQVAGRWHVDPQVDVPVSIREVVMRRVSSLPIGTQDVLTTASVLGRDFDLDLLLGLHPDPEVVLDRIDDAIRARLVEETGAGHYRFTHSLVRTTLYEALSMTRRTRLHARAASVLVELHPDDVVALAHHGTAAGDADHAAAWEIAAAEQALASRALAEAEQRFTSALSLVSRDDQPATAARALCGLGEAQRDQGDQRFRETLADAAGLADTAGEVDLIVRAALADDRGTTLVSAPDAGRVARLERALQLVDRGPSVARARLLTRLVGEVTFAGDPSRRRRLTIEAEAMARQLDDRDAVAHVMVRTGMAAHMISDWRTSLARARQSVALANEVADPALRVTALSWLTSSLVVAGELREAEDTSAQMAVIAAEASPSMRWFARVAQVKFLSLRGRLEAAAAENDACLDLGLSLQEPDAEAIWGAVAAGIAVNAGTTASFADAAGAFADRYPTVPSWRAGQVAFLAEAGRLDEARAVLERHPIEPERLMEEPFAYQGPWSLAVAASQLRDPWLGRRLHRVLHPHRGRWSHIYVGILGPVTWALGRCARATGALDVAVRDLSLARVESRRAAATAVSGLVALDLAAVLAERAGASDRAAALDLLDEVEPYLDHRVATLREVLAS